MASDQRDFEYEQCQRDRIHRGALRALRPRRRPGVALTAAAPKTHRHQRTHLLTHRLFESTPCQQAFGATADEAEQGVRGHSPFTSGSMHCCSPCANI